MSLGKFIRSYSRLLYQHLLPPACLFCGYQTNLEQPICSTCQQDLPILSQQCRRCAQFLHGNTHFPLCGSCQKKPPVFDRTYALFPYEGPIISLIVQLKFQHQLSHAQALGLLMAQQIQQVWYKNRVLPDLILPIPLHPKRLKERGFNQALEISRPIAKKLGLPLDTTGATRIKHTTAQSGLLAAERRHNIADAFALHTDYSGRTVAILDDVITTGHTIRAFSKAVKAAGADEIHVWCCARRS